MAKLVLISKVIQDLDRFNYSNINYIHICYIISFCCCSLCCYKLQKNFWNICKDFVDEWNLFYNETSSKVEIYNENLYNEFIKDFK